MAQLPVTFVFHPEWWHRNYGLSFERDFFYDAATRVEVDLRMRQILQERFAQYGLEQKKTQSPDPVLGRSIWPQVTSFPNYSAAKWSLVRVPHPR